MSLYNANITTRLIDPVFNQANFRTEFRLHPDTVYLTNWRLINVGVDGDDSEYHGVLGVESCIKNIYLYDGNQLLDQIIDAPRVRTFQKLNTTNDPNGSVEGVTTGNQLGFVVTGIPSIDSGTERPKSDDYKTIEITPQPDSIQTDAEDTVQGRVSLREVLPILEASLSMPTTLFRKLRLVIEWNSNAQMAQIIKDNDLTDIKTLQPVLIVDELTGGNRREQLLRDFSGINWNCIEGDRVTLNAVQGLSVGNPTAEQKERFNLNGFTNKSVNRMWLVQTPTDKTTYQENTTTNFRWSASTGSIAQFKPKYQFRVNGANKLTRNGWGGVNRRLAHLTDTFGDFNVPASQNQVWLEEGTNISDLEGLVGQIDYTGLMVGEKINELQIDIDRVGVVGNPATSQTININVFGEVRKSVVVGGNNSYNVIYS